MDSQTKLVCRTLCQLYPQLNVVVSYIWQCLKKETDYITCYLDEYQCKEDDEKGGTEEKWVEKELVRQKRKRIRKWD